MQNYYPSVGGVQLTAQWSMKSLRERGFEFCVVTSSFRGQPDVEVLEGIPIYRLPFREALESKDPTSIFQIQRKVSQIKREFRPDVVHVALNDGSPLFHLMTEKVHEAPTVLSLHGSIPAEVTESGTIAGRLVAKAYLILCVGQHLIDSLSETLPEAAEKCRLLPNARPGFESSPTEPPDNPSILFVGSFNRQKNTSMTIAAHSLVVQEISEAHLTLVGDGKGRADLEEQTAQLGLERAVIFCGRLPHTEVVQQMKEHALVVLSSHWEGIPGVLLEAALSGRPVVATDVKGTREFVEHGTTGLLVEPDNPNALAEAIVLLLRNPERLKSMGRSARQHSLKNWSWEQRIDLIETFYRAAV